MRFLLKILVALVVLWTMGFLWFWLTLPKPVNSAAHTDGIVALTGGEGRLASAIELLEQGLARRVLITGVHPTTGKRLLAVQLGVRQEVMDCCVDIEHEAGNTVGNARAAALWVRQQKIRSVRLVTSDYHMPRALVEFRAALPDVEILPSPVAGPINFTGLVGEYVKYSVRLVSIRFDGAPI
ncbi:YdcF family protein [Pedomonas mirosovicensis]|uniref:YdcF family protein n=1 Tax=Pedomonas mirosovicensis TaxID=2908641 RepID=UPI0021679961|nr:YdcF family protein [Pedomonas mirosovicensis]MCH8684969.1 YdcF family protein [Pedomonas mirosovicensis]